MGLILPPPREITLLYATANKDFTGLVTPVRSTAQPSHSHQGRILMRVHANVQQDTYGIRGHVLGIAPK